VAVVGPEVRSRVLLRLWDAERKTPDIGFTLTAAETT
jgi:hypothetical protein